MKGFGWPSEEDLKNQMSAILRIQHIYDLSTHEVSFSNALLGSLTEVL